MTLLILATIMDRIHGQVQYWSHDWKGLLLVIFIGAVAGLLAEFIVGSKGFNMLITCILGIIGGWLGNVIFRHYNLSLTSNALINQIIYATAGAMIIVIVLSFVFRLRGKDRTEWRA